ncbi:MAG: thioredoxin reductase (NADPH) [Chloroflexi bacterium]|jgi:glutaredoxin-like protein|nr:MAG: thioredoxin reductase (NADPH) [Chloroflexota bacterium]
MKTEKLVVYGAPWCGDCVRAKHILNKNSVPHTWIDISEDEEAVAKVKDINEGRQIIPTLIFPDGSVLVEPSNSELLKKLDALSMI